MEELLIFIEVYALQIIVVLIIAFFALAFYVFRRDGGYGYLERFAVDLTELARRGDIGPVIGREEEVRKIIRTLSRRQKNNVVLVGKAGVGKTAIGEGLAIAIAEKKVPMALRTKRVFALDLTALVSGTKYRGEFEKRMNGIMREIALGKRSIILFIDELHLLSTAGQAEGAIGAGDILKPSLARGDLQVVGSTTPIEYAKYVQQDATLERRFQPILVPEPSAEETLRILQGIRPRFEKFHGVKITDAALEEAVRSSNEYLQDRNYPDKAIDILDETASGKNLARATNSEIPAVVGADDIIHIAKEVHIEI